MPLHRAMTPDSAPNVQQLLAFYLEAGVDCALAEEPVNRLSDPDMCPRAGSAAENRKTRAGRDAATARRGSPRAGGRDRIGPGGGAHRAFA